jgi:hypothetical protein
MQDLVYPRERVRIVWNSAGGEATRIQHLPSPCRTPQGPGD